MKSPSTPRKVAEHVLKLLGVPGAGSLDEFNVAFSDLNLRDSIGMDCFEDQSGRTWFRASDMTRFCGIRDDKVWDLLDVAHESAL